MEVAISIIDTDIYNRRRKKGGRAVVYGSRELSGGFPTHCQLSVKSSLHAHYPTHCRLKNHNRPLHCGPLETWRVLGIYSKLRCFSCVFRIHMNDENDNTIVPFDPLRYISVLSFDNESHD